MTDAVGRDVFFVCNNVQELGGLQRVVHQLAQIMSAHGHRVHLIGIERPEHQHDYGQDLPYDITVLSDGHPPTPWSPKRPWDYLRAGRWWTELHRRRAMTRTVARLDALFAQARPGGIVVVPQVWAMRWVERADTRGMPVVGMSHESWGASAASWRRRGVKQHFPDVARLLLLTQEDADAWARDGLANVGVMPNPLTLLPEHPSPLSEDVVVALGRFSFEKGYDMLLEAWALAVASRPGWRLRLYGSGPLQQQLQELATQLGIADTVQFPGQTTDVEGVLAQASIYALSSRAEGFPMALLEAGAMGLPSVAFDCAPGVHEIIDDGRTGLLAPTGNVDRLADALITLMGDPALRRELGAAARERVEQFHPDAIMQRWEDVFALVER